jgi:hypothetical protein
MALQRELAKEFGLYPATTNPEDIERHRRLNAAAEAASAHGYRYDPCDRCGQATRYTQWPTRCLCNRSCSKEDLERWLWTREQ